MPRSHARKQDGFTLVELMIAVLIIGILAAVMFAVFDGQRTSAKNSHAKVAVRQAYAAARSYKTDSDTYAGMCVAEGSGSCSSSNSLHGQESTIGTTEPADDAKPGSSADPRSIWLGDGSSGNDPTTDTMVMCSLSKGNAIYCIRDEAGNVTFTQNINPGTLSDVSTTGTDPDNFTNNGWDGGSTTQPTDPGPCGNFSRLYCQSVMALGPGIYWRLGETSGSTAPNLTGDTTYDGTYGAGGTQGMTGALTTGDTDGAYRANATATSPVTNPNDLTFRMKTTTMWAKIDSGSSADLFTAGTTSSGWGFQVSSISATQGQIRVWCRSTSAYSGFFSNLTEIRHGEWFHLSIKNETSDGVVQLYVNGDYKGAISNLVGCGNKSGSGLKVGSPAGAAVTIDEFAMYFYGLVAPEVQGLYSAR